MAESRNSGITGGDDMQNHDTQKAFFALLRSGLWNLPVSHEQLFHSKTDWNGILMLALKQTVPGWVADAIFRLEEDRQPGQEILLRLVNRVSATARRHAVINDTLAKVVTRLEAEGIHPVLLKGQGVASLYPEPTLRMCGDIDLYVGMRDYTRACRRMMELAGDDTGYTETVKHFHMEMNGVTVELHRMTERLFNPRQDKRFRRWSEARLHPDETAVIGLGGIKVHTPPPDFNAMYIFNHLWHHFLCGGVGLRQLCDWAMVLHTQPLPLEKERLGAQLKAFGLWEVWRTFGCIVVDKLGLPEDEFPFYDGSRRLQAAHILNRILREGNFGRYAHAQDSRPDGIIRGKFRSFRRISRRTAEIVGVSPLRALEYYIHFVLHGVQAVPKALLGIRTGYMDAGSEAETDKGISNIKGKKNS